MWSGAFKVDPSRLPNSAEFQHAQAAQAMGRRWVHIQTTIGSTARVSTPAAAAQTPAGTLANADGTDGPWIRSTTGAVVGNAGDFSDSGLYRRDWGVWGRWRIKTGADISSVRIKCGFVSGASSNTDYGGSLSSAELVYSTPSSFVGWRALTNDASAGTGTSSGDLMAIAASTVYIIDVKMEAARVRFGINGNWLYDSRTDLPTSSTLLFGRCQVTTQTAATRAMLYSRSTYLYDT